MERTPAKVKKAIRMADGFVCAHPSCNIPFLEYHHFDPPWKVENHNNPEGIIAFCPIHHGKADGGLYSLEQLRKWKSEAKGKYQDISANLDWMKGSIGLLFSGALSIRNRCELMINNTPVIWVNYIDGIACLNIQLFDEKGELLLQMIDNDWTVKNEVVNDIECKPYGKRITIHFKNGDYLALGFEEYKSPIYFLEKNESFKTSFYGLDSYFPLSIVSIKAKLFGGKITFNKNTLKSNRMVMQGCISLENGTPGIELYY